MSRSSRHVKVTLDGEVLAESNRALALFETGLPPRWYLPREDVRMELLPEVDHSTHCPYKGHARYFALGDVERAAWNYPAPIAGMEALKDLVAFHFDALDKWLEEDEPVIGHPRDPYTPIDVSRSSRHVKVTLDGEVLAESNRALALFETGLPPRWYRPREDVRMERLRSSQTRTTAPTRATPRPSPQAGTTTSPGPTSSPIARSSRSAT